MNFSMLLVVGAGVSLTPCVAPAVVTPIETPEPSLDVVWARQARARILITRDDPIEDRCVGVLLGRDIGDGIPGLNIDVPEPWAVELAYTNRFGQDCHRVFPQGHRILAASSAAGLVAWDEDTENLQGVPDQLEVDVMVDFGDGRGPTELFSTEADVVEVYPR